MISWKRRLHKLLFLVSYWETSDKALASLQSRAAWLLPPLKEEILQYNSKIMCCLKKFQLPKTPSHPELESVAPCFKKKKKIQSYKLPSFLSSSFPFHVSPARLEAEVGISIAFTSSTSPHISEQWFSFLYQTAQNLTWSQLNQATVLLSRGLTVHSKSSWNCPQTSVAFNAHTM